MLLICLGIAAFKLWLVAADEIVARENPLDQIRYLEMAREIARSGWLGDFGPLTLIREPGYPVWVALVERLGIPLRIANELLLLAAAGAFGAALRRAGASEVSAVGCFALLALDPHSLLVNRDALPASFYLPTLLIGLAALITALGAARFRSLALWAGFAGLAFGWLFATRPEKAMLFVPVGMLAVADLAASRWLGEAWRPAAIRAAILLAAPVATAALVVGVFATLNQVHYGVFATSGVAGNGYLAANRALLSIEQSHPRRFVPVPREVRQRAYLVSPAFRELEPVLEAPSWARGVSCTIDGVCDDIAAGYFRWLLREAAAAAGHFESPATADRFFARIAREVEAACETRELRCRTAATPFLHPYPSTWLGDLPESLRRVAARAITPGDPPTWDAAADPPGTAARVRHLFDVTANRRPSRTTNGRVSLRGRATVQHDPLREVAIAFAAGNRVPPRAVEPLAKHAATSTSGFAFEFEFPKHTRDFAAAGPLLEFERGSGAIVAVPVGAILETPSDHDGVEVELVAFDETGRESRLRRAARIGLWLSHPILYFALTLAGLLGALALLGPWRRDRAADPLLGVALVLLVWVALRLALLAVVDASSFPARSSRYVYPAASLYACAMLLLAEQGWRNLRVRRAARRPSSRRGRVRGGA